MKRSWLLALLAFTMVFVGVAAAYAGPLPGAIFTTTVNGSRVNANLYLAKEDVYLDGGPGPNAPVGAAALPAGDYYFQVTDPAGKVLLSKDPVSSRKVRVNSYGVIDKVYPASVLTKYNGKWYGTHLTGIDRDHTAQGAITVQLMPYADTPNMGGVYKVWITPVAKYAPGLGKFGFVPADSKTDNYKVKGGKPFTPPTIKVRKYNDLNANGVWDAGEPELFDWTATTTDPLGVSFAAKLMPFTVVNADTGTYSFTEQAKDHWFQTSVYVDGVKKTLSATALVTVLGNSGETHEVIFGNAQKATVKAFKFCDHNLNGVFDESEVAVADVTFTLTGTDIYGNAVGPIVVKTDADGYAVWSDLIPGNYTVVETVPSGSFATTPVSWGVTVKPGECLMHDFGNACLVKVKGAKYYDVNTNGVWDVDENPVPGWKVVLTGTDYLGNPVGPDVKFTGADGYAVWDGLLPGEYTVTEVMPLDLGWFNVTPLSRTFTTLEGDVVSVYFGNAYKCYVGFRTKGFWHNQNGLLILAAHPEWIAYVNTLAPYSGNPFDGLNPDGSKVPAAKGPAGETIADEGTGLAEVSNFLVDSNSDYQQLEQQLLAFIFNVKWRGVDVIVTPDGPMATQDMINSGVAAWVSGTDVVKWAGIFDGYNNLEGTAPGTGVPVVCPNPGPIEYIQ